MREQNISASDSMLYRTIPNHKSSVKRTSPFLDLNYINKKLLKFAEASEDEKFRVRIKRKSKPKRIHYQAQYIKTVRHKVRRRFKKESRTIKITSSDDDFTCNHDKVHYPTVINSVIGKIVEKNKGEVTEFTLKPMPSQGFPVAKKRDLSKKDVLTEQKVLVGTDFLSGKEIESDSIDTVQPNTIMNLHYNSSDSHEDAELDSGVSEKKFDDSPVVAMVNYEKNKKIPKFHPYHRINTQPEFIEHLKSVFTIKNNKNDSSIIKQNTETDNFNEFELKPWDELSEDLSKCNPIFGTEIKTTTQSVDNLVTVTKSETKSGVTKQNDEVILKETYDLESKPLHDLLGNQLLLEQEDLTSKSNSMTDKEREIDSIITDDSNSIFTVNDNKNNTKIEEGDELIVLKSFNEFESQSLSDTTESANYVRHLNTSNASADTYITQPLNQKNENSNDIKKEDKTTSEMTVSQNNSAVTKLSAEMNSEEFCEFNSKSMRKLSEKEYEIKQREPWTEFNTLINKEINWESSDHNLVIVKDDGDDSIVTIKRESLDIENAYCIKTAPKIKGNVETESSEEQTKKEQIQLISKFEPSGIKTNISVPKHMSSLNFDISEDSNVSDLINTKSEDFGDFGSKPFCELSGKEILVQQIKLIKFTPSSEMVIITELGNDDHLINNTTVNNNESRSNVDQQRENLTNDPFFYNEIFSHIDINKWLHFDIFEKEKLEWLKDIEHEETIKPDDQFEARFDFKGYLLPYTMAVTEETRTLYHHGLHPHRPGYSLSELFELCRSTILQQKVIALNIIAGILEYNSVGTYKDILQLPLSEIFFRIRFAIDDNRPIILEPALKAMRNLICNRVDEASLDSLLGLIDGVIQPNYEFKNSLEITELEFKEFMKQEYHIAENNIINALLKSNIRQRFYYILEKIRPNYYCVQYCLQMLSRLIRENITTAKKIVEDSHLMHTIFKHFIPVTALNFHFKPQIIYKGKPILSALKVIRILAAQSQELAKILINDYEIIKPITVYISSGVNDTYGLKIQIEAYSILTNIIHMNVAIDKITSLSPILIGTFHKHVRHTNVLANSSVLSATHAAVVIQLVNKVVNVNVQNYNRFRRQVIPMLSEVLRKWTAQLCYSSSYTAGLLRPICSALYFCKCIMLSTKVPLKFLSVILKELVSSKIYNEMADKLISYSNLLSGIENKDLYMDKNLKTLCTTIIDSSEKILPSLREDSPVTLFASIFHLLPLLDDKDLIIQIVNKMIPYIKHLCKLKDPSLCANWFTRTETDLIYNILQTAFLKETKLDTNLVFMLSHRLCCILRKYQSSKVEFIFNNIYFNQKFMSSLQTFNLMSIIGITNPSKIKFHISQIKVWYKDSYSLYKKIANKNKDMLWQQPALPRDWLYLPIKVLYDVHHNEEWRFNEKEEIRKFAYVECNLRWVLFLDTCHPDLLEEIDFTDRFLLLMSVFLLDKSIYSHHEANDLLKKSVIAMIKKNKSFDFEKRFLGVYNFEDFFKEIIEAFKLGSDDEVFTSCVLVPIAQKHNVRWRKMLWSNHASCPLGLKCSQQLRFYNKTEYLHPTETDDSLIKLYLEALKCFSVKSNSLSYVIAVHHIKASKIDCDFVIKNVATKSKKKTVIQR